MADRYGAQLLLDDAITGNRHEQEYRRWRDEHPEVFRRYVAAARARRQHGKRFNVAKLTEDIRCNEELPDAPGFRINNNYRAYIARDLLAEIPELTGMLKIRAVAGDEDHEEDQTP